MHIDHPAALQQLAEQRFVDLARDGATRYPAAPRKWRRYARRRGAAPDENGPGQRPAAGHLLERHAWRWAA